MSLELKPFHSAVFRKVGDGPVELVRIIDPSKVREPRIPLRRRLWARLTAPYWRWRYRRMIWRAFDNGIVIVRGDVNVGPYPPCSLPPGKRWTRVGKRVGVESDGDA